MRIATLLVAGAIAMLLAVAPSMACRGPQFETSTVLDTLPAAARMQEVVARIAIVELLKPPWRTADDWTLTPLIRMRVVEAIKGVQEGQTFIVDTGGTSCDQLLPRDEKFAAQMIGWRPYIAGQFRRTGSENVFHGFWRRDLITGEYLRAE